MRYLVFGDVHSNFDGLTAVLREGEKRGVEAYLFLGDLVGYGPDPLECVKCVMDLAKTGSLAWVAGNHELVVRGDILPTTYSVEARTTLEWTKEQLAGAPWALKFLESAPLTAKVNGPLWMTHESLAEPGSGRYNREPADAHPELLALAERGGRVCLYGHTHRQRAELMDHSRKLLAVEMEPHEGEGLDTEPLILDGGMLAWVGAGSAGFPVSKRKAAEFLIIDDEQWCIEKYAVQYPRDRVKSRAVAVLTPRVGPKLRNEWRVGCEQENIMNAFEYRKNELFCEGVSLKKLAEKFGTPLYVYSAGHIVGQWQALDRAFGELEHLVCFAMKANSNLSVLRSLAKAGAGFDIVSAGELYRVVQAGGDPRKCVFSGVGKTREEIAYALKQGIYSFNVESEPELRAISEVASRGHKRAPISLRVNPGVDPDTHHYISTGKHESKFGIALEDAFGVYRRASRLPGIEIRGVQMHIGSQITKTAPFVLAEKKLLPLVEQVRKLAPETLQFVDIGGGLGICYKDQAPPTAEEYAAAVLPALRKVGLKILLEPGRFIVGNGGVLVTRVLYVKRTPVKNFVIVDAAMNDLIRPSLYESYHEIVPVDKIRRGKMTADVVGPVCESGDFLAQGRTLPAVDEGELLSVMSAGAYGMAMSSNYNSRGRAAEVLVSGQKVDVVRDREQWADLTAGEKFASWLK